MSSNQWSKLTSPCIAKGAIKLECSNKSFILASDTCGNWSLSDDDGAFESDFTCVIKSIDIESFETSISMIGWKVLADVLTVMLRDTKGVKMMSMLEIVYICTKMKLFEDKCSSTEVRRYVCIGLMIEASMLKDALLNIADHKKADSVVDSTTDTRCDNERTDSADNNMEIVHDSIKTFKDECIAIAEPVCEAAYKVKCAAKPNGIEYNKDDLYKPKSKKGKKKQKKFATESATTW